MVWSEYGSSSIAVEMPNSIEKEDKYLSREIQSFVVEFEDSLLRDGKHRARLTVLLLFQLQTDVSFE